MALSSVLNPLAAMFAPRAATTSEAAVPAIPSQSTVPTSGPAQGSNVPAFQQSGTEPPKPASLMADHANLFTIDKQEGDVAPTLDDAYLTIDNDKVIELAKGMNFVPNGPEMQALAQKALSGDAQAFAEYNNALMQNMYASILTQTSRISEKIARAGVTRLQATIPNTVRSISTTNNLTTQNPIFSDPASKPMVDMIRSQVELKNPTATPEQVTEQVTKYFQDFAAVLAPKAKPAETPNPYGGTTDYTDFFQK